MIKSLCSRLVQRFTGRQPAMQSMFTFAVAWNPNGTRTLTVFEGREAASIELSPEWAAELARLLTIEADCGNDGDQRSPLRSSPAVLLDVDTHG
ncbi:hypothetical protein [Cupriavidus basilensis]